MADQPLILRSQDLSGDGGAVKEVFCEGLPDRGSPPEGAPVYLHYTGCLADGTEFDSSIKRGEPFKFKVGTGMVIKGWDLCVATMLVGEKCKLTLTPEYAYGAEGFLEEGGGGIPPNSTIIFTMELVNFDKPIDTIPERIEAANKIKDEGNALFAAQSYQAAYDAYERALDFFRHIFPKDEERTLMEQCKIPILLNQAACMLKLTNYRSARLCCEQALDYDPHNVKATFRLGQAWQGMADYEKARFNFDLALKLEPTSADIKRALANLTKLEAKHKAQEQALCAKMFG